MDKITFYETLEEATQLPDADPGDGQVWGQVVFAEPIQTPLVWIDEIEDFMTKDDISNLALRIHQERPTTLEIRLLLQKFADALIEERQYNHTEQHVAQLKYEIKHLRLLIDTYAEEAAKGSHACKHCRTILDWYSVPVSHAKSS